MSTLSSEAIEGKVKTDISLFLTVPELAELLHVNEKKVYQLAGCGQIPGTKITGKWIFPRRLIEDWLIENSHGGVLHDRLLIGGSDDRFVQQLCSEAAIDWQHHALLSYSPSGTRHGLTMLDCGRIDVCFINWGASESSARRHMGLLRRYRNYSSWVIVRCLIRKQGLVLSDPTASSLSRHGNLLAEKLLLQKDIRWAMRHNDSGAERFLDDLCATHGIELTDLQVTTRCSNERTALAAVNNGLADATCGVQSAAVEFNLPYLHVADVSLDLVMSRQTYFRSLVQEFLARLQNNRACDLAKSLGGYSVLPKAELVNLN